MLDPLTIGGQVISIVRVIDQALKLVQALKAAPAEFETTVKHVESLTALLENVRVDLISNPSSVINNKNKPAKIRQSRRAQLARLIENCDNSLKSVQPLLKKYQSVSASIWRAWRWSAEGKGKVASIEADLVWWISQINTFMGLEGLNALGRVEIIVEELQAGNKAIFQLLERILAERATPGSYNTELRVPKRPNTGRPKTKKAKPAGPSIGQTVLASLFICRLKARVKKRRRANQSKPQQRRPPIQRVPTFTEPPLKRRTTLWCDLAGTLAGAPAPPHQRLECWSIREGQFAFGGSPLHAGKQVVRGQAQLAEMVRVFGGAKTAATASKPLERGHPAVKWILRQRNGGWSGKGKWELAAARIQAIDASAHGLTQTKKILVVLKCKV